MTVTGYEYGVTCPECGAHTDISHKDDPSEGVECVGWYQDGEPTGCGRTLRVRVEVVEEDADSAGESR